MSVTPEEREKAIQGCDTYDKVGTWSDFYLGTSGYE